MIANLLTVVLIALHPSEQTLLSVHFVALIAELCSSFATQGGASWQVSPLLILYIACEVFLVVFDYYLHPVRGALGLVLHHDHLDAGAVG